MSPVAGCPQVFAAHTSSQEKGVPCVPPLCGPGPTPVLCFRHRGRTPGRMDPRGSALFLLTGSPRAAVPGVPGARGPTGSRPRAPECRGWFIRGRAFLIWFGWIYFWEPVAWQWTRDAQGHASPTAHLSPPHPGNGIWWPRIPPGHPWDGGQGPAGAKFAARAGFWRDGKDGPPFLEGNGDVLGKLRHGAWRGGTPTPSRLLHC